MATKDENSNIIIKLASKGFTHEEIVDFIGFIESHHPTEEEVIAAIKQATENGKAKEQ